jgi:hypothetical protein
MTFHLSRDWADWILFISPVVTLILTVTAVVLAAPPRKGDRLFRTLSAADNHSGGTTPWQKFRRAASPRTSAHSETK